MTTSGYKIQKILGKFGIGITSYSELQRLQLLEDNQAQFDLRFLEKFEEQTAGKLIQLVSMSESQLRQDLFILAASGFKRDGFFVEFGAADGRHLSNSYLLEEQFGWTGILSEPAKTWHGKILQNRPKTILEKSCVWSNSGSTLTFRETSNAELSTLEEFAANDEHAFARNAAVKYEVNTISLNDLLEKHGAPSRPDYLSIDTEGSEYQILKELDFSRFKFTFITCEHNYSHERQSIYDLLSAHDYVRVLESVSDFDDWYVLRSEWEQWKRLVK